MSAALSATREHLADPGSRLERVRYIARLMAEKRWRSGASTQELAAEWGLALNTVEYCSAEASRLLKILGERDAILDIVRVGAASRLDAASASEFVPVARLLVDTVGGFTSKTELTVHEGASKQDLLKLVLDEIGSDPETREHAITYLTALRDAAPAQLTEGSE